MQLHQNPCRISPVTARILRQAGRCLPVDAVSLERDGVIASSWRVPLGSLVHLYSLAALTVQVYKMVAFRGVAKAFRRQHPDDEYVAGLWRTALVAQMPWRATETKRYDECIAPSWSWVSLHDRVLPSTIHYWRSMSFDQIPAVLECDLQHRDSALRLHLASGILTLQGSIIEARISHLPKSISTDPSMPAVQGRLRSTETTLATQQGTTSGPSSCTSYHCCQARIRRMLMATRMSCMACYCNWNP